MKINEDAWFQDPWFDNHKKMPALEYYRYFVQDKFWDVRMGQ